MTEPLRHSDTPRSDRKSLRQAKNVLGELEHFLLQNIKQRGKLEYAISKQHKLINRLKSSVVQLAVHKEQ